MFVGSILEVSIFAHGGNVFGVEAPNFLIPTAEPDFVRYNSYWHTAPAVLEPKIVFVPDRKITAAEI
jgi:hypothetical protein